MKKKIVLFLAAITLVVAALILIFTQQPETLFDGARISDQGRFALQFDRMNRTDSETLSLAEGDALRVSWQIESGQIDVTIGMEGEEALYRANDRAAGDEADFCVEIPETGSYTITVSAREAKGRIEFLNQQANNEVEYVLTQNQINMEGKKMNRYIAYCGLNCEKCEARLATINNDDALRAKVAKLWSELNSVEITPDMINCDGCRIDGIKTPYCDTLCPIRQCARGKKMGTCGDCAEVQTCEKAGMILGNNEEARRNLGM